MANFLQTVLSASIITCRSNCTFVISPAPSVSIASNIASAASWWHGSQMEGDKGEVTIALVKWSRPIGASATLSNSAAIFFVVSSRADTGVSSHHLLIVGRRWR